MTNEEAFKRLVDVSNRIPLSSDALLLCYRFACALETIWFVASMYGLYVQAHTDTTDDYGFQINDPVSWCLLALVSLGIPVILRWHVLSMLNVKRLASDMDVFVHNRIDTLNTLYRYANNAAVLSSYASMLGMIGLSVFAGPEWLVTPLLFVLLFVFAQVVISMFGLLADTALPKQQASA